MYTSVIAVTADWVIGPKYSQSESCTVWNSYCSHTIVTLIQLPPPVFELTRKLNVANK